MAAVSPAGPEPKIINLECEVVAATFAAGVATGVLAGSLEPKSIVKPFSVMPSL